MNRRLFLRWSAAAAVALGSGGAAWGGAPPGTRIYKYIYDSRFAVCRSFAAALRGGAGFGIAAIAGDITALWANDLRQRWSAGEGAIGGIVTARTLFCLEELAKDHRMRVVVRVEQRDSDAVRLPHFDQQLVSFVIA